MNALKYFTEVKYVCGCVCVKLSELARLHGNQIFKEPLWLCHKFKHLAELTSNNRLMDTWVGWCEICVSYRIFR